MTQQQMQKIIKHEWLAFCKNNNLDEIVVLDIKTHAPLTFDQWAETQVLFDINDIIFAIHKNDHPRLTLNQYVILFKIATQNENNLNTPVFLNIEENGTLLVWCHDGIPHWFS